MKIQNDILIKKPLRSLRSLCVFALERLSCPWDFNAKVAKVSQSAQSRDRFCPQIANRKSQIVNASALAWHSQIANRKSQTVNASALAWHSQIANRKSQIVNVSALAWHSQIVNSKSQIVNSKAAFTIVELLVVIAIIAILAGAITMGVNGMFYKSRMGRAKAMRNMLQTGLETYYARTGEWPTPIRNKVDSVREDSVLLTADEADQCFRAIVKVSTGQNSNPVMDPSGLFVAKGIDSYGCTDIHKDWQKALDWQLVSADTHRCNGKCPRGREFADATKKGSKNKISLSQMNFGYAGPNHGRFCRFRLYYYPKSDTVKVLLQPANEAGGNSNYANGFIDD